MNEFGQSNQFKKHKNQEDGESWCFSKDLKLLMSEKL